MFIEEKAQVVHQICESILRNNILYSTEQAKGYFDYEGVLKLLRDASSLMGDSLRFERPKDLNQPRNPDVDLFWKHGLPKHAHMPEPER